MALSEQVTDSLDDAESSLRNALAFAARNERPMICREIAKMISQIETIQHADGILDTLSPPTSAENPITMDTYQNPSGPPEV